MKKRGLQAVFAVIALAGITGCANQQEWSTWYDHRTHFASGDHMSFSIATPDTGAAVVTRRQLTAARDEGWWGKPVTVGQAQILEQ